MREGGSSPVNLEWERSTTHPNIRGAKWTLGTSGGKGETGEANGEPPDPSLLVGGHREGIERRAAYSTLMKTTRLQVLSCGVLAIVITVMVGELQVRGSADPHVAAMCYSVLARLVSSVGHRLNETGRTIRMSPERRVEWFVSARTADGAVQ